MRGLTPATQGSTRIKVRLPDPRRSGEFYDLTHAHNGIAERPMIPISALPPVDHPVDGSSFAPGAAGPGPLRLEVRDHNVGVYRKVFEPWVD